MAKIEDRRHHRHEVEEPAFMRVLGPPGGAFVVTILDISKGGLRVRCSLPIDSGTRVEVRCRKTMIEGEVRYSRGVDASEFHLGIQAKTVSDQSDSASEGVAEIDLTVLFPDLTEH